MRLRMRAARTRAIQLHIVLEKQKKGYTVYIPELPGCISEGETKEEALKNIKEAKDLYLEELSGAKFKQTISRVQVLPLVFR